MSSYYRYHVFFCTNQRDDGTQCCQQYQAQAARDYVKQRVKDLGAAIPGHVRINNAGCMNRCAEGPVVVIYPQAVWYTYVDNSDLDAIIEEHLVHGRVVERLLI